LVSALMVGGLAAVDVVIVADGMVYKVKMGKV